MIATARSRTLLMGLRLRQILSAYLPIAVMAFLALGTWWLVKHSPQPDGPQAAKGFKHIPDYLMRDFEVQRFAQSGALRVVLAGREARHYPDTDTLEVDDVRVQSYSADGQVSVATAKRAIANADGTEVQLIGQALVRQYGRPQDATAAPATPQLEVEGEFLHAFYLTEQVRSHQPVRLSYRGAVVTAQGFDYDNLSGKLALTGPLRAALPPSQKTPTTLAKRP